MKFSFLSILFLICLLNNGHSQTVITGSTITSPPAPSGTTNPIDLSTNGGVSVTFYAEDEIVLTAVSSTDYFWVKENSSGSNFFLAVIVPQFGYSELKKELDGGYTQVLDDDLLRFKFIEEYFTPSNRPLNYKVYDKSNILVGGLPTGIFVNYGDNRYNLNVATLTTGEFYILEVQNEKNEKWYLRFKIN
jgi:hypothetical protein